MAFLISPPTFTYPLYHLHLYIISSGHLWGFPCPFLFLSPSLSSSLAVHIDEEAPSPYVGIIDLRQELKSEKHPGMYRVPCSGLVQVMICNPQRTGIKVFLIKYDFRDMPPNTHTFLRQRTFVSSAPRRYSSVTACLASVFSYHACTLCGSPN